MIDALVVGGGSIGKRHLRNLLASGRAAAIVDPRADRREEIAGKHPAARVFASLEEALAAETYRAGFVCLPTAYHLGPAMELARRGLHLFMEKPLSHSPAGVRELADAVARAGLVGLTGFCMRFFAPLRKAAELVHGGRIGRVVTARSLTAVYLPDWHPWEDYRTFYMAKREMGGGVLLDECHAFDWMQWLIGPIQGVFSVVGTLSDLEVTSDDVCEVIARFGSRTVASIHLDMVDRSSRTQVELIGTTSTLLVDMHAHSVKLYDHAKGKWQEWTFAPSYDQMYLDEIDHFFDCVARKSKPNVDLRDGYRVQRIIDACARSSDTGRWVAVD